MQEIASILHAVIDGPIASMFAMVTGLFILFCGMELGLNHLSNYIAKRKSQHQIDKQYSQNLF